MTYRIDRERRLVLTMGWGVISTGDVQEVSERILGDPAFEAEYRSLVDLSAVTDITVDSGALMGSAARPRFRNDSRRAFVAPSDVAYGMARMFATLAEQSGQEVRVFRERHLAEEWLGLT
jgi:TnpA family transposase